MWSPPSGSAGRPRRPTRQPWHLPGGAGDARSRQVLQPVSEPAAHCGWGGDPQPHGHQHRGRRPDDGHPDRHGTLTRSEAVVASATAAFGVAGLLLRVRRVELLGKCRQLRGRPAGCLADGGPLVEALAGLVEVPLAPGHSPGVPAGLLAVCLRTAAGPAVTIRP